MADNVMARKDGQWTIVSMTPDVCKTPMGSSTPPVPYPVTASLGDSQATSTTVFANGNPIVRFDSSYAPTTVGDAAGTAHGIQSGTVGAKCWPIDHSKTVRVEGKMVVRHGDQFWMNGNYPGEEGNTIGKLYGAAAPSSAVVEAANAPVAAATGWMGWIHGGLDALGAIPEIGAVFDGANALVYSAEGNVVQASVSGGAALLDLVPVAGSAGKIAEFGVKGAMKLAARETAERTAKKEAARLAEVEAKEVREQSTKEATEQAEKEAASKEGKDGGKVTGKGRCTLRPYKPDTCKVEGKTGHHVVADRAFRLPGKRTGADRRQLPGGLSEADGLVICLEGKDRTPTTEHGKAHALYDAAELALGLKGKPPGTTELWKLEAAGAASVAAVTKCNPAALMAQLRAYHQLKGMGPDFVVRADPTGALTKGMKLKDFAEQMKTGAGDF